MTYDQFYTTWNGKGADFDGWYGDQCVDLFNFYNRDVVGAPFIPTTDTGGAADLFNDFDKTAAPQFYDRLYAGAVFQKGDVVVWAANTAVTGAAGHVGIFDHSDNGFYSFDQNYPTGSLPHLQHHDYRGILGVLRPKGGDMPSTADINILRIVHTEEEGWPFAETHAGQHDAEFLAAYGTQTETNKLVLDKFLANSDYHTKREEAFKLAAQVPDLTQQVQAQGATIDGLNAQVTQLQAELVAAKTAARTSPSQPNTAPVDPSTPQLNTSRLATILSAVADFFKSLIK